MCFHRQEDHFVHAVFYVMFFVCLLVSNLAGGRLSRANPPQFVRKAKYETLCTEWVEKVCNICGVHRSRCVVQLPYFKVLSC
jgi:hypothetical protein